MRKIVAILIGLVMLFSVPAFGEELDITSGVYMEGQDLEAGIYSFTCSSTNDGYCVVATFQSEEQYNLYTESKGVVDGLRENSLYYEIIHRNETCAIRIDNGCLLLIEYGDGSLSIEQLFDETGDTKEATHKESYEALLSILRSTELTSGEKLMARIRYQAEVKSGIDAAIATYEISLGTMGYSNYQAKQIILKAQLGEEIHPFHDAEYDLYNMPAEKNGLENEPIFIDGTIVKYVSNGGKKNCAYGLIVEQEDGHQWLVYCAEKVNGELVGKLSGSKPEQHIFEGYSNRTVRIYGKYLGLSEEYKLPVIDIVTYGGMLLIDENALVRTNTSGYYMDRDCIYGFDYLIGAETCYVSGERYWIN